MQVHSLILVTGSNGQLGKELKQIAPLFPQFDFIFLSREDLPVHHFEMVRHYFTVYKPVFLINCAAYTAVDKAEEEKEKVFQVNAGAAGVLADECKKNNCHFIHISTDYVFDGSGTAPYKEEDAMNPQGVYGASKAEGEKEIMKYNPDSIIIRTAWVYSEFGKNFVKTMLKLMQEREEVKVVNDQIGSPTYAADLAEAIMQIIASGKWKPGVYHYSNDGIISWFDFATTIKELSGLGCRILPITTAEFPTAAKRPAYSVLDKLKIQKTFNLQIQNWRKSLQRCLEKLA